MIDRKELKATAKARMAQSDPSYWKVMLVWTAAAVLLPQVVLSLVGGTSEAMLKFSQLLEGGIDPELALRALQLSAGQMFSTWVLSLVLSIYQMVLSFGLATYVLRLYRGQSGGFSDLFSGFSMVGRVLGQQILVALIMIGCAIAITIPVTLIGVFAATVNETLGGILFAGILIAGMVLLVVVMLNYSLATIALADQPDLGAMGAIQYGKNLIRGHKGQYVVLSLSFFGWGLLCSLLSWIFAGVVAALPLPLPGWTTQLISVALMFPYYLWLTPYMQTTFAGFYDALRLESEAPPQMPLL